MKQSVKTYAYSIYDIPSKLRNKQTVNLKSNIKQC